MDLNSRNSNPSKILSEGLKAGDLEYLVSNLIHIDTYASKMGEDQDVIVVSFTCHEQYPAQDLTGYLERGYDYILDADASTGEDEHGNYIVFVEFERTPKFPNQLIRILDDVENLVNFGDWYFKYYKSERSHEVSSENLAQNVPLTAEKYNAMLNDNTANEIDDFFGDSLLDDITVEEGKVILTRKNQSKTFKLVTEDIATEGAILLDEDSLSKVRDLVYFIGSPMHVELIGSNFVLSKDHRKIILNPND